MPAPVSRRAMAAAALAASLTACSGSAHPRASARPSSPATFGGFPTFLPKDTINTSVLHGIVDASGAKPVLATQGDTVRVHLSHGTVLANIVGPEVPNEGLPYQLPTSPATWTVSLSGATGTVPLSVAAFTASDDRGTIYHPFLIPGSAPLPATVAPGSIVTFKIRATILTGEGLLRWAPDSRTRQIAEWDFVVEDD